MSEPWDQRDAYRDEHGAVVAGLTVTCREIVELVTDYLEGEVDTATAAEIEAHLALCEACTVYLDQMRATIDLLGHVPEESLSDAAKNDLMSAFRDFRATGG